MNAQQIMTIFFLMTTGVSTQRRFLAQSRRGALTLLTEFLRRYERYDHLSSSEEDSDGPSEISIESKDCMFFSPTIATDANGECIETPSDERLYCATKRRQAIVAVNETACHIDMPCTAVYLHMVPMHGVCDVDPSTRKVICRNDQLVRQGTFTTCRDGGDLRNLIHV